MNEFKKKAFDATIDLVKQLITLATGTLALTAIFIKDIVGLIKGEAHYDLCHLWALYTTWICMLFSIYMGILANSAVVSALDKHDESKEITIYSCNISIPLQLQWFVFLIGIVFLIIFSILTLK